jgi:hypothetical protein
MDLSTLARVLEASPELNRVLSYEGVITYIDLIRILKPDLNCWQPPHQEGPPERLPLATHDFLKLCLNLEDELAKLAWHALRQIAWNAGVEGEDIHQTCARLKYLHLFLKHGPCRGIGE